MSRHLAAVALLAALLGGCAATGPVPAASDRGSAMSEMHARFPMTILRF